MTGWRGRKAAMGLACASALAVLLGCGGGGGSSSPGGGTGVVPTPTPTPSPTPTPPPTGSALTQADARIGACINMSNQLEGDPTEGSWGRPISNTDFAEIRAKGFQTVRIPVRWQTHALAAAPYTIDAAWMNRVEQVVNQARAAGLRVILNVHHYDALFANPDAHRDRFAAFWQQIGERFKNADNMVWFELINEPHDRLTDANLASVIGPALANVRATNPTRPVVIGGQNYSGIDSLASLPLPADRYIIATFHYYDPFDFTHQGASFLANPPPTGRVFGGQADIDYLDASVTKARNFMTRTGVPVFLGEYGAYQTIPATNRALYYKSVTDAFRAANIDGCVWGYTSSFNFREDALGGAWDTAMLTAIGL